MRISYEGRQVSEGLFDTLTDAKVALTLAKADAVKGMFIPPAEKRRAAREKAAAEAARTLTLGQWAHEWLATFAGLVEISQRSKATYHEYESVLSLYVLTAWAKTPLSQSRPQIWKRSSPPSWQGKAQKPATKSCALSAPSSTPQSNKAPGASISPL